MRLAILSRNKNLHSVRRLLQEAALVNVDVDVVNPLECQLVVEGRHNRVMMGNQDLPRYDAILPRIGASITDYGLAVVKQFETQGAFLINDSQAIAESRDKMRCLQILAGAGIRVPATVLTRSARGLRLAVEAAKGLPVILKVLQGTQGVGVMLVHTPASLGSVHDTLRGLGQDVIIQQFIGEAQGRDYRAFVIGNQVVAAMLRTAPEGDFRSNIHRGGQGKLVKLPKSFEKAAIRAAQVLGLQVAGIDLMESESGPMVLEANSSPGFEGIEKATGLNIASQILRYIVEQTGARRGRRAGARRPATKS